jgi:hypothetical protein
MTLVFRNHCRERDLNLDTNQQLFDVGILAQSFGDVDPANQDPLGLLHTQSGQMRTWEKEGCLSTKSRGKARFVEKYGALSSSKNETRIINRTINCTRRCTSRIEDSHFRRKSRRCRSGPCNESRRQKNLDGRKNGEKKLTNNQEDWGRILFGSEELQRFFLVTISIFFFSNLACRIQ